MLCVEYSIPSPGDFLCALLVHLGQASSEHLPAKGTSHRLTVHQHTNQNRNLDQPQWHNYRNENLQPVDSAALCLGNFYQL